MPVVVVGVVVLRHCTLLHSDMRFRVPRSSVERLEFSSDASVARFLAVASPARKFHFLAYGRIFILICSVIFSYRTCLISLAIPMAFEAKISRKTIPRRFEQLTPKIEGSGSWRCARDKIRQWIRFR